MPKTSRQELERALALYNAARDEASHGGDWSVWAARFTEDAHYVEHAYGELHGRDAIRDWIQKVMAPYPTMTFPQDWVAFDEEQGAVVFQCQTAFPPPFDLDGRPFGFPSWTRLVYGRDGLWAAEGDVYNPARDAPRRDRQLQHAVGEGVWGRVLPSPAGEPREASPRLAEA